LKQDYTKKKQELQILIEEKDNQIAELRKELADTRASFNIKYEAVVKECGLAQESVKAGKKLCELYSVDNEAMQSKVNQMEKEMKLLRNEIQFLESENKRITVDNVRFFNIFLT